MKIHKNAKHKPAQVILEQETYENIQINDKNPGLSRVKKPSTFPVPKQGTQTENIKNFLERNQAS